MSSGGGKPGSDGWVLVAVAGLFGLGAASVAWSWLVENRVLVLGWVKQATVVVLSLFIVGRLLWGWWSSRSGGAGGKAVGDGWDVGDREELAVVLASGGGGRSSVGLDPRRRVSPVLEFWPVLLRQAAGLSSPARVVRVLWAVVGGKLVWGVSVDRELGRSVRRAVGSVWPAARVVEWPAGADDRAGGVAKVEGGAVVRRFLVPENLFLPLETPSGLVDHPMGRVSDVVADHGEVDVGLRVDLVPLSPGERDRVCADRLKELGEGDPDRSVWEREDKRGLVCGVRVLLRVSRSGPGHLAECTRVADRICGVLDSFWSTDYNRLVVGKVNDGLFDRMWESGVLERDVPAWHWDSLGVLLAPPPANIAKTSTSRRLPDPPSLATFDPRSPGGLMPIGIVSEGGRDRLVGVPWGEATEALVDWTVGATGSGKTWHATSRVIALAETGRGLLYLDPHRTAVGDIKPYLAGRHADRILEIDLQATNTRGEPVSAGWNPLDLTVVPAQMRKGRIDNLKGMLPVALFPDYVGPDAKAPQTATIIRKTLECLLNLNYHLPPRIQANIFCLENLLLDEEWRNLAVARLPDRDQKWWHHTYPMIVGAKGPSSAALKPALNALEQWKTQDRVQALLGASQSTVRWRDIIDGDKILFVVLNNDRSETDNLLARLMVGEMVTAFKERGLSSQKGKPIRPFHLFFDEFQSYAAVLESLPEVIVQELRKFRAKVHFINQSPSAVPRKAGKAILSNRTHLFIGRLGSPADAKSIAEAMGGQQPPRQPGNNDHRPAPIEGRDLLGMPRWHFICQITENGKPSPPFQLKGINVEQTWAPLRTDRDITQQITENTGLEPVDQRLDHYDTLPERIAQWLRTTGKPPTTPTLVGTDGSPPVGKQPTNEATPPADTRPAWAKDCIIEDPAAVTPTALFAISYTQWCQTKNIQPLPDTQLQRYLTRRYGPSQPVRIAGKVTRARKGIKLRNPRTRNRYVTRNTPTRPGETTKPYTRPQNSQTTRNNSQTHTLLLHPTTSPSPTANSQQREPLTGQPPLPGCGG